MRYVGTILIGVVLAFSPASVCGQTADPPEPPLRLKKKEKPPPLGATEKKTEPVRPPEPKEPSEPALNPVEVWVRITTNMRASEDRLKKHDPGEGTRLIQRDILKDLDTYIEARRQQQQQQAASSKDPRDRQQPGSRSQTQTSRTPQPEGANQLQGEMASQAGRGTKRNVDGMNKIADLYKDVWGHLPETLRQEMDQYSREKFMAKYGDLLKQYYSTIAEKGNRKGD